MEGNLGAGSIKSSKRVHGARENDKMEYTAKEKEGA